MEQITMEQLAELLKVQIGGLASKMEANQEKMDAIEHKREANKAESMANQLRIEAEMKATQHVIKAHHEEMMAKMDAWRGVTTACLEEEEPDPEEPKAVAETKEVPEGATDEEAIGVTEDRSRNLRLAVRCRGRLKTWTKCDGRLRQDCAASVGRPTRRFVPALCKGGLRKGPGKKCHSGTGGQKCCRIGIRGQGKASGSRMEDGGLKQQRIKDNVVRGARKERTRPVFENGIRNQGARKSILRTNGRRCMRPSGISSKRRP
jgi:hypothetical protein